MVPLTELWLPILLSAVLVFVVSSLIHMVLTYHNTDYGAVADEDRLMDALRVEGLEPGEYVVPHVRTTKELSSPEYIAKRERGPVAFITVLPAGKTGMGSTLAAWFLYSVVVSIIAAYVGGRALGPGAEYGEVYRFVGTTAIAGYVLALWQQSIWYGKPWSTTLKNSFDGLVYGMLTAGVFGWLWP